MTTRVSVVELLEFATQAMCVCLSNFRPIKMPDFHAIGWSLTALRWVWVGKREELYVETKKTHRKTHNRSIGQKHRISDPKARNPGKSQFPIPVGVKIFAPVFCNYRLIVMSLAHWPRNSINQLERSHAQHSQIELKALTELEVQLCKVS
jgi:hypothetical protein